MSNISTPSKIRKLDVTIDDLKALTMVKFFKPKAARLKTKFLVYAAKHLGEIVYIGSGSNGREKHCTSGCSHVYGLNKLHFRKEPVTVDVVERFTSKEESLNYESRLIAELKPKFNIIDNPHIASDFQYPLIEKWSEYFKIFGEINYQLYMRIFKDLMSKYSIPELVSENGVPVAGLYRMHRIGELLNCKGSSVEQYEKYIHLHDVFCTIKGRIKIPIEPPEYQTKETNE